MRMLQLRVRYGRAGHFPASVLAGWAAVVTAPLATPEWRPACDIVESATEWLVQAELAGVADDDVEILLYEDSIVIEGMRPWRGGVGDIRVHLAEVRYGPFRLAVQTPPDADLDAARASYDRGMLTLVLPKTGTRGQG